MNVLNSVLGWVLPILLGPLVYVAMRELLNVSRRVDDLPPAAKRLLVTVAGTAFAFGVEALGVSLPSECEQIRDGISKACETALLGKPFIKGVTAAAVAMVLHALKKSRPND